MHLPKLLYVALQGFRSVGSEMSSFSSSLSSPGRGSAGVTGGQLPPSCCPAARGAQREKSSVASWVARLKQTRPVLHSLSKGFAEIRFVEGIF